MSPAARYAWIFAATAIFAKLGVYALHLQYDNRADFGIIAVNLLCVLLAVFFGMRGESLLAKEKTGFVFNVKSGVKSAALFSLALAVFLFIYYKYVDPGYLETKITEWTHAAEQLDVSAADSSVVQSGSSREAMIAKQVQTARTVFSPFYHATFSLLGLMLVGGLYAFLIAWLQKLVYRKNLPPPPV